MAKYHALPLTTAVDANISMPKGIKNNRWAESLRLGGEGSLVFTNMRIVGRGEKESYEFSYYFYPEKDAKSQVVTSHVKDLLENHTSVTDNIAGVTWDQATYL